MVGDGTSSLLHSILFPSVSKAVTKLKRVPVVVVGPASVQFCGASDKLGKTEAWDGGCVLQVRRAAHAPHARSSALLRCFPPGGACTQRAPCQGPLHARC